MLRRCAEFVTDSDAVGDQAAPRGVDQETPLDRSKPSESEEEETLLDEGDNILQQLGSDFEIAIGALLR